MIWLHLLACGQVVDLTGKNPPPDSVDPVTWHADVAPILTEHCVSCHVAGGIAENWPFDSYAGARVANRLIAERTASGAMPPFRAHDAPDCTPRFPFVWDPRLDAVELATLQAWADGGAQEGDADEAVPLTPPQLPTLDDWTLDLAPAQPFVPPQGDNHICFVLPLGLDHDTWINATEILPGDPSVVHHVQVRLDLDGDLAAKANADGWYECWGAIEGTDLGGFLPGSAPSILPTNTAILAPAGSAIVTQIHYHVADDTPHPDTTRVHVRTVDTAPLREPRFQRVGNDLAPTSFGGLMPGDTGDLQFFIPAGATHHTEAMRYDFDVPGTWAVYLVANHMHAVGATTRLWVEHADPVEDEPDEECLLAVDPWDIDWQAYYGFDVDGFSAPLVRQGDSLWLECVYDNTLDNAQLADLLDTEGIHEVFDVGYGNTVLDEMCAAVLGMVEVTDVGGWPGETPPPPDTGTPTVTDTGTPPVTTPVDTDPPPQDTGTPDDTGYEPPPDLPPADGGPVLISEIIDHATEGAIKVVELFNAGPTPIDVGGFALALWANGASEPVTSVLAPHTLDAGAYMVLLAPDADAEFEAVFDATADATCASVTGNGDDAYALLAPDGSTWDQYGEPGVDGTGTTWEYVDAVVTRDPNVRLGRTHWEPSEWGIVQGSGTASPGEAPVPQDLGADDIRDIRTGLIGEGEAVHLEGVMVTASATDGVFVQERGDVVWTGIFVYLGVNWELDWGTLVPGDLVTVDGVYQEYRSRSEVDVAHALDPDLRRTGTDLPPIPKVLDGADFAAGPESWESMLIVVLDTEVLDPVALDPSFVVTDAGGSIPVGADLWTYAGDTSVGVEFAKIVGILGGLDDAYAVWPRSAEDVVAAE